MKSEVDSEMFPPTQAALDFRIIRSSFVSKDGRNADKAVPFITDSLLISVSTNIIRIYLYNHLLCSTILK